MVETDIVIPTCLSSVSGLTFGFSAAGSDALLVPLDGRFKYVYIVY